MLSVLWWPVPQLNILSVSDGVIVREDVDAVLGALLDIRHELRRIRILLHEDEDDGETEEKREDL
jgi:hypothetical protein